MQETPLAISAASLSMVVAWVKTEYERCENEAICVGAETLLKASWSYEHTYCGVSLKSEEHTSTGTEWCLAASVRACDPLAAMRLQRAHESMEE